MEVCTPVEVINVKMNALEGNLVYNQDMAEYIGMEIFISFS